MKTSQLSEQTVLSILGEGREVFFDVGEEILPQYQVSNKIWWIKSGSVRGLVAFGESYQLRTIEIHKAGSLIGWLDNYYQRKLDHLRAAEETVALEFTGETFLEKLQTNLSLKSWFQEQCPQAEVFHLIQQLSRNNPIYGEQFALFKSLSKKARWSINAEPISHDFSDFGQWYLPDGTPWSKEICQENTSQMRFIWLPDLEHIKSQSITKAQISKLVEVPKPPDDLKITSARIFELPRASGPRDIPFAICQAIALHMGVPLNRDSLLDQVNAVLERQPQLNLFNIGQLSAVSIFPSP